MIYDRRGMSREFAVYPQLEERTQVLPNPYAFPKDFEESQYWKDRCRHCHRDVLQGCDPSCTKLAPVRDAFYEAFGFHNQNPSGAYCLCAPGVICNNCSVGPNRSVGCSAHIGVGQG